MSERLAQDVLFHGRVVTLEILGPETIGVRRGELTPELLEHLKAHKGEIIAEACRQEWERWQSERPAPGDDPRPDLVEDSAQWAALLSAAYELDGEDPTGVWAALHVVRCLARRSAYSAASGGWRLAPTMTATGKRIERAICYPGRRQSSACWQRWQRDRPPLAPGRRRVCEM